MYDRHLVRVMRACTAETRCARFLFVVPNPDLMAGLGEGTPRDVEPTIAREELVCQFMSLEEVDQAVELLRVLGADVGSLALQVLRVADTTHMAVDILVAEAGVDEDGADHLPGRFQEHHAAIDHVRHVLQRGLVARVFLRVDEFLQRKVLTESCVFHSRCV